MNEINPYESPKHASPPPSADTRDDNSQKGAAGRTWRSQDFVFALAQQGVLLGITALILDDGTTFRVCLTAVIAHWVGIAIVVMRHRTSPTVLDLGFLKFGFFFCLFVAFVFAVALVSLRP